MRAAEVTGGAIRENAASINGTLNHPTGDPASSPEDVVGNRTIHSTGKVMDIGVLDHVIIGGGRFTSLMEMELGFS